MSQFNFTSLPTIIAGEIELIPNLTYLPPANSVPIGSVRVAQDSGVFYFNQPINGWVTIVVESIGTGVVTSVNGLTGTVVLTTSNITEGSNLYFTDARAQSAVVVQTITSGDTLHASSSNALFNALALKVPTSRNINTTSPLLGGGSLGSDLTLSIQQADATHNGYLSSVDWNTFNNKQTAGNYITALTSDVSATGPGSVAATVNSVGGSSAANIHSAELAANAATSSNTINTIVKRDGSGNFSAGTITANLTGNVTGTASGNVPNSRNVNTTAPLTGGGALSSDLTIAIPKADATHDGYLSSGDWSTFNTTSGSAITALTGDVTATGPGSVASTIAVGAVTDAKASLAVKPSADVVATTNQSVSGFPTIDGVTVAAGNVVLLTAQSTGSQNGPWVAASGAWTRPTWYPSGGTTQAFKNIRVAIKSGTVYQGSMWYQSVSAPITIDTTSTTWAISALAINSTTITAAVPISAGGTGQTTANSALNALLPTQSGNAGTFLTTDGSNTSWVAAYQNIDGGRPDTVYTALQTIQGGTP
jgi:hypothetical protein